MKRSRVLWTALGAALAALALLGGLKVVPALAESRGEFDMLAMLSEIHRTNGDIKETNAAISVSLQGVVEQVGGVERVHGRLGAMESLLAEQNEQLGRLEALTAEQAALSRELRALTAQAEPSMAAMAAVAKEEAAALGRMSAKTAGLAERLRDIRTLNGRTLTKLKEAESLSARILSQLP